MDTTFLKFLFFFCTSDQQKKHKLCREPSNEHSYKDWFQVLQRRRKQCQVLQTTDDDEQHQVITMPHLTLYVKVS